jgi:putative component of membrane protein insertase Oxa1/YidC/SpoIIIJ protein YidD
MQMTRFILMNVSLNKLDEDDHVKVTPYFKMYRKLLYTTLTKRCRFRPAHSRTAYGDFYLHFIILSHFLKFNKTFPDK